MKKYPGPKLLLLVCLLLLPLGFAVGKLRSQEKTPAAPHATLADFSWLAGRWEGNLGNVTAEQTWIPARNGTMQGMFRLTDTEKTIVVELFTIRETTDGVFFYLRHFSPELVPQEKEDAYRMKLAKWDSTHFQFDNTSMPFSLYLTWTITPPMPTSLATMASHASLKSPTVA